VVSVADPYERIFSFLDRIVPKPSAKLPIFKIELLYCAVRFMVNDTNPLVGAR
jgi:hypothetical protein